MASPRQLGEELFFLHLEEIESIVRSVARQRRSSPDEAQELRSVVMMRLIENDYAVLRQFRGTSSWRTYLTVIIQRLLLDLRNQEWGRWRPSATARRLGSVAVELEGRIERDGMDSSLAIRQLLAEGVMGTALDLERLVAQLPNRRRHRVEPIETCLEALGGQRWDDDSGFVLERREVMAELDVAFGSALGDLSQQERVLLGLRFGRGWTVRRIAVRQQEKERTLYRRFQGILRRLHLSLKAAGFGWQDIASSLDSNEAALDLDLRA